MDRWLPPRAPGAHPPPRFDAAPSPVGDVAPEASAAPAEERDTRTAPAEERDSRTAPADEPDTRTALTEDPDTRTAPAEEPDTRTAPADEPDTRTAPAGWAPPTARRDPPATRRDAPAAAPPARSGRHRAPPTRFAPPLPPADGDRAATGAGERTAAEPPRFTAVRTDAPRLGAARPDGPAVGSAPARGPVRRTPAQGATRPNAAAVWGLVFGIIGVALLFLSLGTLFVLTLPCSTAAWVLGRRAIRQIERGETVSGAGQARLALWLGRIGVVVGLGAMIAFIVLTLAGFDFDQLRENLRQDLERRRDAAR